MLSQEVTGAGCCSCSGVGFLVLVSSLLFFFGIAIGLRLLILSFYDGVVVFM